MRIKYVFATLALLFSTLVGCSSTSELIEIPDVVGLRADLAEDQIESAGFEDVSLEDESGDKSVWKASNWTVTSQVPEAGSSVDPDTKVFLYLHHDIDDEVESEPSESPTEGTATATPDTTPTNSHAPVVPGDYEMPDFTGEVATDAADTLVDAGLTSSVNYLDAETGESPSIFVGWTVESQYPEPGAMIDLAENEVTFYMAEGDGLSDDKSDNVNSGGLDAVGAVRACGAVWETVLKNEFPQSDVKVHTWIGVLAEELQDDDTFFVKIEASIDDNTVNVECNVGGSRYDPQVVPLNVY